MKPIVVTGWSAAELTKAVAPFAKNKFYRVSSFQRIKKYEWKAKVQNLTRRKIA